MTAVGEAKRTRGNRGQAREKGEKLEVEKARRKGRKEGLGQGKRKKRR